MAIDSCILDRPGKTAQMQSPAATAQTSNPLNLLAYVHLRNIHGSTGAGRTARQIVEHLGKRSDIHMRILADAGDQRRILPLVQAPWTGYRYHTFSADTSRQQARWFWLDHPKAETFWEDARLVYCTAESYVPVAKARLAVTAHDAGYFENGAHHRDAGYWKQRLKWRLLFQKLSKRVDLFHTVSEFSASRLAHFFPEIASRIRCVHNGVTPHFFAPVTDAGRIFLSESGLGTRQFVLVPGGLHFRKNAELILEASRVLLERFPDLVIAVVNHSHPCYIAQAESLGERFRLLGFVSDEALHACYSAAQLVWFPSRYEGFGLPVVEAMACGTAVVASDSSSIPEIAGAAALLVDPSQMDAHVEAVSTLLTNDQWRQHYAELGKDRSKQFTWDKSAADLKQHFDGLL
ncbi:glycosyltransferase involved in cell wall biosynthesis [Silvibacterium bohemicum]|uniref:Glycosyltransferase involved in cell wall biosynthesis n=1 Tax=Silvibacterium bohemicum TaxID=1577686 RepID=A0A841JT56_9BACT|nr:glycosyltransferase family 1 protein [Silvibacterium bohemicum]MBB6143677.1 glycosyltransferase involved in cell wall biosynthesis [Silvibacterium bohemicum]